MSLQGSPRQAEGMGVAEQTKGLRSSQFLSPRQIYLVKE